MNPKKQNTKIIVVNIGTSLAAGHSHLHSTERAWPLNPDRCKKHQYVIGVVNGVIMAYFRLIDAFPDDIDRKKVAFNLSPCTSTEIHNINTYVNSNSIGLRYVRSGKYI